MRRIFEWEAQNHSTFTWKPRSANAAVLRATYARKALAAAGLMIPEDPRTWNAVWQKRLHDQLGFKARSIERFGRVCDYSRQ